MRWLATCESCAKSCGRGCGIRITLLVFYECRSRLFKAGPHLESHSPSSFRVMTVPLLFSILSSIPLIVHIMVLKTGPADPTGSTGNRPLIWSGYNKKLEIALKSVNIANRPVQPENRKPERLNWFCKISESLKQIYNGAFFAIKIFFFSQIC